MQMLDSKGGGGSNVVDAAFEKSAPATTTAATGTSGPAPTLDNFDDDVPF